MDDDYWGEEVNPANTHKNNYSNYRAPQRSDNMNWRSERGRQQRDGDTRAYKQEDSYRTGGRRMNMDSEKSSEMLIDNSFVGKVIGKGGSKIRELQDESNAYIKVLKNDSGATDTSIRLSGTSEAIEKAKTLIEDLISDDTYSSERDSYRTGGSRMNMNTEVSCEIFIDNSLVGKVIGKGGSKIRELQDESKAYIKVLENDSGAADTSIKLSGTSEAIEKAKTLIEDLTSDDAYSSERDSYRTGGSRMNMNDTYSSERDSYRTGGSQMNMNTEVSCEIFINNSLVGKVIGKGGSKIRELQDESKAYIKVLENDSGAADTSIKLSGTSEAIEKAKTLIEDLISDDAYSSERDPYRTGGSRMNMNDTYSSERDSYRTGGSRMNMNDTYSSERDSYRTGGSQMNMNTEVSCEIFINNSLVGKVIGKGGSKIRELQDESKAYIKVLENDSGAADTSIKLSGTSEAIEKAKTLIEDLISDDTYSSERDSYRAGGSRMNMNDEESSEIFIDNSFVGKVIGKGGSKIRELQDESKAYIKVLENNCGAADTSIKLSGTSEAIAKAKFLIEDLISGVSNLSVENNQMRPSNNYTYTQASEDEPFDWAGLLKQSEEAKIKKLASLPPIIKNFYQEDPEVASMRTEDVKKFRIENNSISVMKVDFDDDKKIPNPVTSFKQAFHNYPELLEELRKQGFSAPSPIQSQAWPILLQGYDMIGIAQTGTGKTIAFLFPALVHIIGQVTPREKRVGPSALILAPTRELAQQIESEAKKYQYKGITSICIYGGGNRRNQINLVNKGIDIIIATPGRLNDLCMNGFVDVSGVTYLVLDEADRMLDMGFEPQIRKIVIDIREDRQTVMTSATWTEAIQELAARYMTKPFKVNVGAFDLAAVHSVTQEIIFGEDDYDERRRLLDEFIKTMGPDDKAIVFVEKKAIADDIASDLNLRGTEVQSIHGDREQCDREQALDDLKTGYVKILIATDVASRGIDIKDITIVFNLFFPRNIEEYVHRVGRTGRAGRTGKAISVVTRKDWNHAADLIRILEEADQYVPDELYDMASRYKAWKDKKMAEDRAAGGRGRSGRGGRNRY